MASEIRVNQIQNRSGLGTVTFSDTGVIISGITTISDLRTSGTSVVAAGTTAAPSISPTGDSNTGIFFPSADTIAFGEGGAEAARIDSNGRLGVGTVLPNTKLHIAEDGDTTLTIQSITGSGQSPSIRLQRGTYGTDGFNDLRIYNVTGALLVDNIDSAGAATNLLYANPTGVGIGSTIPENKLDVNGTIKSYSGANKATFKDNQLRSDASGTFYFDHGTASQSFTFRTSTSTSLDTTGPSITSAGNISFPSGKGIDFSATANSSGTMTSELLSDYEEGTWTPTLDARTTNFSSVTYGSYRVGYYTRVGNMVYISCYVSTTAHSGGSGELRISGTPFTIAGGSSDAGPPIVCYSNSMTSQYAVVATPFNTALWELYYYTNSGGFGNILVSNLPQTSYIKMAGSYRV